MPSNGNDTAVIVICVLLVLVVIGLIFLCYKRLNSKGFQRLDRTNTGLDNYDGRFDHATPDIETVEFVGNPLIDQDTHSKIERQSVVSNESQSTPRSEKSKRYSTYPSTKSDDQEPPDPDPYYNETIENVFLDGIVKAGYLKKKSTSMKKDWLKRWFFIKDAKLYYIHKPTDIIGKKNIQAVLVANLLITSVKETADCGFQITSPGQRKSVSGGGVYLVQGDDMDDIRDWMAVIQQQIEGSIVKSSELSDSNFFNEADDIAKPLRDEDLRELREANPFCADCGATNPEWASLNICIMVCIECSGVHRSLGAHISKVRSLTLDKWTPNAMRLLIEVGNQRSNSIWDARADVVQDKLTPAGSRELRTRFITDKYKSKNYIVRKLQQAEANSMMLRAAKAGNLTGIIGAIAAGADVNAHAPPDQALRCAVHLATLGNHIMCVELLCAFGANLDEMDAAGKTAMFVAIEKRLSDIENVLAFHSRNRQANYSRL